MKHRTRFVGVIGVFIAGLMAAGCDKPTSGAAQMGMGGPPEVAFVTVQPERVAVTTELPARTAAYLIAEVRPQVGGIIQKRLFEEGGDVKQGDVLYDIDPALYQAAYDTAVAALARSEANLPSIKLRASRYEEAVAAKAISQQEYDDAVGALKQVNADVAYGRAAVQSAHINLGYTRVTAPISGRIGKSNVTVGALVSAHQAVPLSTIQQLDPIYVDAPQSSANLLRIKSLVASGRIKTNGSDQARVKILLEDGTPYRLEGTLKFPDVSVDPTTGSFILRMVVPNPDHVLLPGMYVRAVLEEGVVEKAILAPQQGVSRDYKGNPIAFVVGADNKIQVRPLTTEVAIGDKWVVSSGLTAGDRVVVEGMQKIRPGAVVKPVPFNPAPTTSTQSPQAATQTTQPN